MKLSRRKTILGMGLLAGGSGATLSSAALTSSADSGADMRVVADQSLTVRAGDLFSSLSEVDENTSPSGDINYVAYIGDSTNEDYDTPGNVLFSSNDADGSLTSDSVIDEDDTLETPAVIANGGDDGNFAFAVAVRLNDVVDFSELIEVENNTNSEENVGITFSTFGSDASGVGGNPGGEEAVATQVYRFYEGSSTETRISTDSTGWTSTTDQTPANFMTVGSGDTEQITLSNDTGEGSTGISSGNIRSAVTGATPGFGQNLTDIDLVDTIEIGLDST